MKELVQAFPDIRFEIEDMVAESDKVVVRFMASGTHKGQFGPIPPTGKQVRMLGYITHRLENGRIIEDWVVRDTYGLMMQLGVIQPGRK
jgi:predicted ester cyclase